MRNTNLAVILVVVTVVAFALGSALGTNVLTSQKTTIVKVSTTATVTETNDLLLVSTFTQTITTTRTLAINYSTGLNFVMSINSSTVQQGHNLTVFVGVYNALNGTNNVTGASDWKLTNASEVGPSYNCAQNDPFRVEVIKGYYDLGNFSAGTPLVFTVFEPPFGYNQCLIYVAATNAQAPPLFQSNSPNYYLFNPSSNNAQWIVYGFQGVNQPAIMSETDLLRPVVFTNSTGVFTVVSGDEWGDLEIAHFVLN